MHRYVIKSNQHRRDTPFSTMIHIMRPHRLATLLTIPSVLSASLCILGSLLVLGIANWSYATPASQLYSYLYGQYGLATIFEHSSNALAAVNGIFSSPAGYNVAVVVVALFIGVLIYVLLEGIDHITAEASNSIHLVEQASNDSLRRYMKQQLEIRIGLRLGALFVWVIYLIFFARVIVPFCIIIGRLDLGKLSSSDVLVACGALFMLIFAMHIHVILARLIVLRPRLFGGDDVLIGRDR